MRRGIRRSLLAILTAAVFVAALSLPATAYAQMSWRGRLVRVSEVSFDLVVLRPLQVVGVGVGVAFFIPAALVTAPGGRDPLAEAWTVFVLTPWQEAGQYERRDRRYHAEPQFSAQRSSLFPGDFDQAFNVTQAETGLHGNFLARRSNRYLPVCAVHQLYIQN